MAKPFVLTLNTDEIALLRQPAGSGGHQSLHRRLNEQLSQGDSLILDDAEIGQVLRYMSQYGSGGFQGRLREALIRPLREVLSL